MQRSRLALGFFAVASWLIALSAGAEKPSLPSDPVYDALRKAEISGGSVHVQGLTLVRDAMELRFEEGEIDFAEPVQGRPWLGVFLGKGHMRLTPATKVELEHLRLVTESPTLDALEDEFESAVLVWTDHTGQEVGAERARSGPVSDAAGGKLKQFRKFLLDDVGIELEPRLLQDFYGTPEEGLFLARIDGHHDSDLLYVHDPSGAAHGLMAPEESGLFNADERHGGWWYLAHSRSEVNDGTAERHEPRQGFRALHYDLDTTIGGGARLHSKAVITVHALAANQRVIRFDLDGRLRVDSAVRLPDRTPLTWLQADEDDAFSVSILLPEAPAPGTDLQLEMEYEGKGVILDLPSGVFYVGSRTSWYPNLGAFQNFAAYNLRFCVPQKYELVGVGRRVGAEEHDGQECSTWESEVPLAVAGFNYGRFHKREQKDEDTGLDLEVYTNPGRESGGAGGALVDAINSVRIYSTYFGPLPYSRVAVTEQPAGWFGQAWPTLVYLPYTALTGGPSRVHGGMRLDSMSDFRMTVGPHEMSHQWWGHTVGWRTYRDQWLSEGFAEFSSGLWMEVAQNKKRAHTFWQDDRHAVVAKTIFGQFPYKAGPVTLGYRLGTFQNRGASSLIYEKGAYIVHMLRMMMQSSRGQDTAFIIQSVLAGNAHIWVPEIRISGRTAQRERPRPMRPACHQKQPPGKLEGLSRLRLEGELASIALLHEWRTLPTRGRLGFDFVRQRTGPSAEATPRNGPIGLPPDELYLDANEAGGASSAWSGDLYVCFGGETLPDAELLKTLESRYSGNATVWRKGP